MSATLAMPAAAAASPLGALAQMGAQEMPLPDDATTVVTLEGEGEPVENDVRGKLRRWIEMPNIADDEELSEEDLRSIAFRVSTDYDIDKNSRADWEDKYDDWVKFAMQIADEKTYPWPKASNIIYPLISSAATQFHARAYPAIIRDRNVVKGTVIGKDQGTPQMGPDGQPMMGPDGQPVWAIPPGQKKARADRIGEHMSWQLLDDQPEWEPETDRLLFLVAIVGTVFRKSYFSPDKQRNVSEMVTAKDLVVNYTAKSFESASRKTELIRLYPWEIEEQIRAGVFLDDDYGHDMDGGDQQDEDALVTFLEQHRRWDLDGDGYKEPYIITIARDSQKLARIRAGYDMDGVIFNRRGDVMKIKPVDYYTKYSFLPSPESGVYDLGFGHLLYPINEAINSSLNQMFDAGHLQNAGGGFIGSQLSMNAGKVSFQVGEYKQVNTGGGTIRDNVFPLPFPGPSQVLFALLQFLVQSGKEVAAIKDILVGDLPGDNTSGVATLAMIEQGLQVFTAIYKRIHRALKAEFVKLFRLNRLYLPMSSGYQIGEEWRDISRRDYEQGAGVQPVSDPRMMTDMQRLGRAQFLGQFKGDLWFDQRKLRLLMLDAAQIPDADGLLAQTPPPDPQLGVATAQLQLAHDELNIRGAKQEAEMDIRRAKEKAAEVELLTRSILNLANAQKADAASAQGWYSTQLDHLRAQVEFMNAAAQADHPASNSPAAAAGIVPEPGQANGAGGGNQPLGMAGMAPPPGQPSPAALPGGLPGGA